MIGEDNFNIPDQQPPAPKKSIKKKVLVFSLIAVVITAGIFSVGFAMKLKHFHDHGPLGFMMEQMTKDLDLNDQQKADVQKIKDEIKAKMEAKREDHKKDAEDFENIFRQPAIDKQQLMDIASKREKKREEMKSFMMDELIKFHDLLTDTQRNKVADKIKEFREQKHDKGFWKKDKDDKIQNQ